LRVIADFFVVNHPFLKNRNIIFYLASWLVIAAGFAFSLYYFYEFTVNEALADSLIFNGIFMAVGLALWFVVRYSSFDASQLINLIASHLAAAAMSISLTILATTTSLKNIFVADEEYLTFLSKSVPWRAGLGVMYYSVIILVYYLIRYYDDLNQRMQEQSQLETMLKESELEMLKSQINPHFIFNSLNSISSLTITAPDRARAMVIKLSEFLRYSLGKENDQLNTLDEELNNLLLYLDIEKVRFGDRLQVETDIAEDTKACTLPNLILQPLFENAIKHGIYESLEQVTIRLNAVLDGNILRVTVQNEYDPNAVSRKGKGIGLKNVTQRLQVIYGVPKLVFTEKSEEIFTVRLDIPQIDLEHD